MALTPEQRQIILDAKARGLSKEQATALAFRPEPTQRRVGRFSDVGEDLSSAARGVVTDLQSRGQNIRDGFDAGARGEQTPFETGAQMAGNTLGAAGDIAFRGVQAAVTPLMREEEERAVEQTVTDLFAPVGEAIAQTSPRTQRNIIGGLGLLEGATAGIGAAATRPATNSVGHFLNRLRGRSETPKRTPEQIFEQAEQRIRELSPREAQEAAEGALTWREKMVGLTPDVKNRLGEMGEDKLMEYLNATYTRNIDDTAPTPYEVGSQNVNRAEQALREALNNTGEGIGQTRQKLGTFRMQQTQVDNIDRIFKGELENMGLTIRNGQVIQRPGVISPAAEGDIRALNKLNQDLNTFKQSPTLENAIDLRKNFDSNIKFGKSAREVSNEVDPLSRTVRGVIAEEAATTVGKENAALVKQYSEFMDAYGDLRAYTNRAAGGEYLLRLVLSGRGGDSRRLIQTIKEYTDIDLMDDATAMKVAVDMFGNENTQTLFRQQVTKAGYDAGAVLSGSPTGILDVVVSRIGNSVDTEKLLRDIARGGAASGAFVLVLEDNPELAVPLGFVVGSTNPTTRRAVVKEVAKKVDDATADEMFDFNRVIREGGVTTNNKGELQFKPIEGMDAKRVERVFDDGLRLLEIDRAAMNNLADKSPGDIAAFYDEVLKEITPSE